MKKEEKKKNTESRHKLVDASNKDTFYKIRIFSRILVSRRSRDFSKLFCFTFLTLKV